MHYSVALLTTLAFVLLLLHVYGIAILVLRVISLVEFALQGLAMNWDLWASKCRPLVLVALLLIVVIGVQVVLGVRYIFITRI